MGTIQILIPQGFPSGKEFIKIGFLRYDNEAIIVQAVSLSLCESIMSLGRKTFLFPPEREGQCGGRFFCNEVIRKSKPINFKMLSYWERSNHSLVPMAHRFHRRKRPRPFFLMTYWFMKKMNTCA